MQDQEPAGPGQHRAQITPAQQRRHPRAGPRRPLAEPPNRAPSVSGRGSANVNLRRVPRRLPGVERGLSVYSAISRRPPRPVHQLLWAACSAPGQRGGDFPTTLLPRPHSLIQCLCIQGRGRRTETGKKSCLSGMCNLNEGSLHLIRLPLQKNLFEDRGLCARSGALPSFASLGELRRGGWGLADSCPGSFSLSEARTLCRLQCFNFQAAFRSCLPRRTESGSIGAPTAVRPRPPRLTPRRGPRRLVPKPASRRRPGLWR